MIKSFINWLREDSSDESGYYSRMKEWGFIQPTGAKVRGLQSMDGHDELAQSVGKKDANELIKRGAIKYSVNEDGSSDIEFVDNLNNRKAVIEFLKTNPFAKSEVVLRIKAPKPTTINAISPDEAIKRLQDVHLDEQYKIPYVDDTLDWGYLEPNGDVTDHGDAKCLDDLAKRYRFLGAEDAVTKGLCAFIIAKDGSLHAVMEHDSVMYHQLAIMIAASPYIKSYIEVDVYRNKAFLRKLKFNNGDKANKELEKMSERG